MLLASKPIGAGSSSFRYHSTVRVRVRTQTQTQTQTQTRRKRAYRSLRASCEPPTHGWNIGELQSKLLLDQPNVREVPVAEIRRPLGRVRSNDQLKVDALKQSISEHGLLEPIDVLEVNGVIYGFSGCHRFQAHQELGLETIWCRVRVANEKTLKMHMM